MLSALDIKQRNLSFMRDPDHEYQLIRGSQRDTKRKIMNVRNGDLRRFMREFPICGPLHKQAALWMRGLVGKHFFPDGNHRTAMQTLRYLMVENGIDRRPLDLDTIGGVTMHSKKARRDIVDVRFDTLWERDELYAIWCNYFYATL